MSGIRLAAQTRELSRGSPFLLRALDKPADSPRSRTSGRRAALPAVAFTAGSTRSSSCSIAPASCRWRCERATTITSTAIPTTTSCSATGSRSAARSSRMRSVPPRRREAAPHLQGGDREPDDRGRHFEVPEMSRTRWPAPTCLTNGCSGACSCRRLLDSDAVYFPPGGGFKLVELAPNVQQVVGGRQQPDRRDEGRHRDLRAPVRAVALGHRRRQGEISRQADHPSGADPSPHGPYRRHADLCGGGRDRGRAGADQGLFRAGGEGAACGVAGRAAETAAAAPRSSEVTDT